MNPWRLLCRILRAPERRLRVRGRRDLDRLFREGAGRLAGTSLRPEHRSRTQVLDVTEDPYVVFFGILRHPRPYSFSRQFHEVVEIWSYEVESGRLERVRGVNLTRARQEDGEPSDFG
jgi:hypothetical protein